MSERADAFLIRWSQTSIDGTSAGPLGALVPGARWQWDGRAVEAPGLCPAGRTELARLVSRLLPRGRFCEGLTGEDPVISGEIVLTDGRKRYAGVLITLVELARPVLVFRGALPPRRTELTVAQPQGAPAAAHAPSPRRAVRAR